MHQQDLAIVRALVPVAWADGVFADREKDTLNALLEAYGASAEERDALHAYALEKRSLDDIDLQELSSDDRRVLLQHAVLLSFADGDQSTDEVDFLIKLAEKLRIPPAEAQALLDASADRAKRSLGLL